MEAVHSAEQYMLSAAGEEVPGHAEGAPGGAGSGLAVQSPMLGSINACSSANGMVPQQQWSGLAGAGSVPQSLQLGPSAVPLSAIGAAGAVGGSGRLKALSPEAAAAARASANTKYMSIPNSSRVKERFSNGKAKVPPVDAVKVANGKQQKACQAGPAGAVAAASGGTRGGPSRSSAAGDAEAMQAAANHGQLRRAASAGVAAATAAAGGLAGAAGASSSRHSLSHASKTPTIKSEEKQTVQQQQQQQGKGKGGVKASSSSTPGGGSKVAPAKQQRVPPEVANLSRVELGTAHLNKKRCRTWVDDLDQPQEVEFMPGCVRCSFAKVNGVERGYVVTKSGLKVVA